MRGIALVALVAFAWPQLARAEDPWKIGVTEQQRVTAQKFLEAGNTLFLEKKYPEALKQYEAAVGAWNHPAIRFNIVRCLIQLERPAEAFDALEAALVYGAAPLEDSVYTEALAYRKLLANQIAHLDVSCTQAGTRVSIDGQIVIASCPGKASQRVKPGSHQLVGVKEGYLTQTIDAKVIGGEHETLEVELVPLSNAARVTRRWATWKPWLLFSSGLALVGIGGGLQYIASSNLDSYDRQITADCAARACNPATNPAVAQLVADRDRALVENKVALVSIGVGAAATLTGVVLLYMNRVHTVYERTRLEITPANSGATVTIMGEF